MILRRTLGSPVREIGEEVTEIATKEQTESGQAIPPHPSGGHWPYVAVALNGTTYYSDSATEIIEATLDGYGKLREVIEDGVTDSLDEENDLALVMRYEDLLRYAAAFQEAALSTASQSGEIDLKALSEDQITALTAERLVPFEGIPTSDAADAEMNLEWDLPVPLVLMASDYLPFTQRPQPDGNIVWLDPTTETTYLRSLHSIGVLSLLVGGHD